MAGAAPATSSSRYDTILKLASGGMATVWIGTVRGALGFRQLVAIKKPHPHLLGDERFRSEIVAEARLASMIHHANVVDVRDVEIDGDSISLVMDYIEGASLGELIIAAAATGKPLPARVAVRIAVDTLAGLHAAHELVDERDRPVGLVHRDVSPQNILVGVDGIARVADFGVAKFARKNMASTSDGSLKGKLAYMAPEYLKGESIDRRFDVFALGVVLWEALTGERCFRRKNEAETLQALLGHEPAPISKMAPELGTALDGILACAFAKARDDRFQNAAAMAAALESTAGAAQLIAGHVEVADTVKALAGRAIEERRALAREARERALGGEPARRAGIRERPREADPGADGSDGGADGERGAVDAADDPAHGRCSRATRSAADPQPAIGGGRRPRGAREPAEPAERDAPVGGRDGHPARAFALRADARPTCRIHGRHPAIDCRAASAPCLAVAHRPRCLPHARRRRPVRVAHGVARHAGGRAGDQRARSVRAHACRSDLVGRGIDALRRVLHSFRAGLCERRAVRARGGLVPSCTARRDAPSGRSAASARRLGNVTKTTSESVRQRELTRLA